MDGRLLGCAQPASAIAVPTSQHEASGAGVRGRGIGIGAEKERVSRSFRSGAGRNYSNPRRSGERKVDARRTADGGKRWPQGGRTLARTGHGYLSCGVSCSPRREGRCARQYSSPSLATRKSSSGEESSVRPHTRQWCSAASSSSSSCWASLELLLALGDAALLAPVAHPRRAEEQEVVCQGHRDALGAPPSRCPETSIPRNRKVTPSPATSPAPGRRRTAGSENWETAWRTPGRATCSGRSP